MKKLIQTARSIIRRTIWSLLLALAIVGFVAGFVLSILYDYHSIAQHVFSGVLLVFGNILNVGYSVSTTTGLYYFDFWPYNTIVAIVIFALFSWRAYRRHQDIGKFRSEVLLFTGAILVIFGLAELYAYYKYSPRINAHPKYYITVTGYVAPEIRDKIHMQFSSTYQTSNNSCKIMVSRLEGADFSAEFTKYTKIKINQHGNFNLRIPLDLVIPGYCRWHIDYITYFTDKKTPSYGRYIIAFFNKKKHYQKRQTGYDKWKCNTEGNCKLIASRGFSTIPANRNYHYKIDFRR